MTPVSDEEIDADIARRRETDRSAASPRRRDLPGGQQSAAGTRGAAASPTSSISRSVAARNSARWPSNSRNRRRRRGRRRHRLGDADPDGDRDRSGVQKINPGEMSPPIRAAGGYYIVLVVDQQTGGQAEDDTRVSLVQIMFPLAANASPAAAESHRAGERHRQQAKSCGEMTHGLATSRRRRPRASSARCGSVTCPSSCARRCSACRWRNLAAAPAARRHRRPHGMRAPERRQRHADARGYGRHLTRERFDEPRPRYLRDLRRAAYRRYSRI